MPQVLYSTVARLQVLERPMHRLHVPSVPDGCNGSGSSWVMVSLHAYAAFGTNAIMHRPSEYAVACK
jgi:hypothetical protein